MALIDTLFEQAMKLTDDERERLGARLLGSLRHPDDAEWREELAERLRALDAGEEETDDWATARQFILDNRSAR